MRGALNQPDFPSSHHVGEYRVTFHSKVFSCLSGTFPNLFTGPHNQTQVSQHSRNETVSQGIQCSASANSTARYHLPGLPDCSLGRLRETRICLLQSYSNQHTSRDWMDGTAMVSY